MPHQAAGLSAAGDGRRLAADAADDVRVAADDQQVAGAAQPDVQHLPGALVARAEAVDGEHDGRPLEPLEAEDVPVEDVVAGPVRLPVRVLARAPAARPAPGAASRS